LENNFLRVVLYIKTIQISWKPTP